jgi:hypothetical protein
MKFSHQLKFNSVADWKDHYIHYANLKVHMRYMPKDPALQMSDCTHLDSGLPLQKIIYEIARLEQASQQPHEEDWETGAHEPLLRSGSSRHIDTKAQVGH